MSFWNTLFGRGTATARPRTPARAGTEAQTSSHNDLDFHVINEGKGIPPSVAISMRSEELLDSKSELNEQTLYLIAFLLQKRNVSIDSLSQFRLIEVGPRDRDGKIVTLIDFDASLSDGTRIALNLAAINDIKKNLDSYARAAAASDRAPAVLRRLVNACLEAQPKPEFIKREAHIWIEGSSDEKLGAEILRTLQPESVQHGELRFVTYQVESPWPSNESLIGAAAVALLARGVDLRALMRRDEVRVEEGKAHGRKFYALYLK
jgi:hypothetical protein